MPLAFPPFGTKKSTAAPPADGATTIEASTWRWDGSSGTVLVSSGFALQPGQVTAATASQVRVYVSSVEQSVAIHPLDGAFPDGSYRSIGIQFEYNLTNDTPIASEVKINAGARGTLDLTWEEPTHADHVRMKAVIAPTSPAHLCATMVSLTPLTPASNDTGTDATWATRIENSWNTKAGVRLGSNPGTAIYDHVNGLWALYCRTGTRSYYQWAYDWATEQTTTTIFNSAAVAAHLLLPYMMPPTTSVPSPCGNVSAWNPEALNGTNECGVFQENFSLRILSLASSYWMTGWRQFKRNAALYANRGLYSTNDSTYATSRDYWISANYGVRLNLGQQGMIAVLVGYLLGCTTTLGQFGIPGANTFDYETYLPWMIDALEDEVWAMGGGDYRDGLVGQRHTTIAVWSGDERRGVTNFQLSVVAEFLMLYYDHVYADTRIPGMIQVIGDYIIGQSRAQTSYDFTYPDSPYVSAYDNIPPATVASSTFTATLTNGSPVIVWTAGVTVTDLRPDIGVAGTGIPAGTNISSRSGNNITLTQNATTSGSQTVNLSFTGWTLITFASTFAWLYAYTGNATYNTWATRASVATAITDEQTKTWGETFGGARQAFLYYRYGGTIRGTTGAHPTVITNPPTQASLG